MKNWKITFIILFLASGVFMACRSAQDEKLQIVELYGCEPCLIPRSNSAVMEFKDEVSYYFTNNDSYHVGKIGPSKLTLALTKTDPDSSTLLVLTRDTLVMFHLHADKENIARKYTIKK